MRMSRRRGARLARARLRLRLPRHAAARADLPDLLRPRPVPPDAAGARRLVVLPRALLVRAPGADAQHRGLRERDHPRRPAGGAACPDRGGAGLRHVAASCCSAASSSRSRSGRRCPAYGSEIILMVKATSLASIITMMEVTGIAAQADLADLPGRRDLHLRRRHLPHPQLPRDARDPWPRMVAVAASAPAARGRCRGWKRRMYDRRPAAAPAAVAIRDLRKSFGPLEVLKGVSLQRRGRRRDLDPRRLRLRQVDDAALHQHARGAGRRRGPRSAARRSRSRRTAAAACEPADGGQVDRIRSQRRDGVPELQSLVPHDGARERHRGAGARAEAAAGRMPSPRPRRCSPRSASPRSATTIRPISPAASSSAPRSPARSPCTRR